MKIIHKVSAWLSILAVAVSVLSPISPVYAQNSDSGIGLLAAIGVISDNEISLAESDNFVTRSEAAYYAVKLLGKTDAQISNAWHDCYKDVTSVHKRAGAIALAENMEIVSSAENFYPDDNIILAQLCRMLVSAIGHDAVAVMNGGYPNGYIYAANRAGLLDDIHIGVEQPVTYKQFFRILRNALDADIMEITGIGEDITYTTQKGQTLLTEVYDIYKYKGKVTQSAISSLNTVDGLGGRNVRVGEVVYNAADDSIYRGIAKLMGCNVTIWACENGYSNTPELVYFEEDSSNAVTTVFSEDFSSFNDRVLKYYDGTRIKSVKIPANANILYNGVAVTSVIGSDLFDGRWGEIHLIKGSSNGGVETVSITAYKNYVVSAIDKAGYTIYDSTWEGKKLELGDGGNLKENVFFASKTGEELTYDSIPIGAVLSVAESGEGFAYDIIVVNEQVSGIVTSINSGSDRNKIAEITVDSNVYDAAPELYGERMAAIRAGSSYEFSLDAGGRIAAVKIKAALSGGYVYLIDVREVEEEDTGMLGLRFRVVNSTGEVVSLKNAKTITVDGMKFRDDECGSIKACLSDSEGIVTSGVAKIEVNDDAEIKSIDTHINNVTEERSTRLHTLYEDSAALTYKSNPKSFESRFGITQSTTIFYCPANAANSADKGDLEDYGVLSVGYLQNDSKYSIKAYNTDENSLVSTAVVIEGAGAQKIADQSYIMTISKIMKTVDEDNVPVVLIEGLYIGENKTIKAENNAVLKVSEMTGKALTDNEKENGVGTVTIDKGDSIIFGTDNMGYVNEVELLYDYSEAKSYANNENMDKQVIMQIVCSKLYSYGDGFATLCKDAGLSPGYAANPKRAFTTNSYKVYVVEHNDEFTVRTGSISDLKDYYTYGDDCSIVLLQLRYFEPRTMVIYQQN